MPSIICGHCHETHTSVYDVWYCSPIGQEEAAAAEQAAFDDAAAAEEAYERYLEDRGYFEARAQEDHDARWALGF